MINLKNVFGFATTAVASAVAIKKIAEVKKLKEELESLKIIIESSEAETADLKKIKEIYNNMVLTVDKMSEEVGDENTSDLLESVKDIPVFTDSEDSLTASAKDAVKIYQKKIPGMVADHTKDKFISILSVAADIADEIFNREVSGKLVRPDKSDASTLLRQLADMFSIMEDGEDETIEEMITEMVDDYYRQFWLVDPDRPGNANADFDGDILDTIKSSQEKDGEDDSEIEYEPIHPKTIKLTALDVLCCDNSPLIIESNVDIPVISKMDDVVLVDSIHLQDIHDVLSKSIRSQLRQNYASLIDRDHFESLMDDLLILVGLSTEEGDQTKMVVTDVSAVAPFYYFHTKNGNGKPIVYKVDGDDTFDQKATGYFNNEEERI